MPTILRSMRSVGGRHAAPVHYPHVQTGKVIKVDMSNRAKKEWEEVVKKARVNRTMIAAEYIVEH